MDNPRQFRVVATFTTLPDRYHVLRESIASMRNQDYKLDAIYLAVPFKAKRLNKEYPPIPDDISEMCTVVRTDTDYGPLTKIYGGLVSETDPDTLIISCDDDTIHEPNLVSKLVEHHLDHPDSAICGTGALVGRGLPLISIVSSLAPFRKLNGFTGFNVGKDGRKVDLIFGVAGVLYKRGFFPTNEELNEKLLKYSLMDDKIFLNDDVLISGYLSKEGIPRLLFYDIPNVKCVDSGAGDALSIDVMGMVKRMNEAIVQVKQYGMFPEMEQLDVNETVVWKVVITILVVALIILLAFIMYKLLTPYVFMYIA